MASRPRRLDHGAFAKSLLIVGEDPDALKKLLDEYRQHFAPKAGPETALVDELVRTTWRLRRLDRAEAALTRVAMDKYLADGPPPPPQPAPPADDPLARQLFTLAEPDPSSLFARIQTLDHEILLVRDSLDADADLLRNVAAVVKKGGAEMAAKYLVKLKRNVADFNECIALPGADHGVLEELADGYADADVYLADLKKTVKTRTRAEKRRLQELEAEVAPLKADVAAIFGAGAGVELDPRVKSSERLWDERRRLLRDFDRTLHALLQTRELGVTVTAAGTGPNLRLVK